MKRLQGEHVTGEIGFVELRGIGRIPFVDAKGPLEFEVIEDDIKAGVCKNPEACIFAQSLWRRLGSLFEHVVVGNTRVHIIQNGRSTRFGLGGKLGRAVKHFDKTGAWKLAPGKYTLTPLPKRERRGERENRRKLHGGKGGKQQTLKNKMQAPTRIIRAPGVKSVPSVKPNAIKSKVVKNKEHDKLAKARLNIPAIA